MRFRGHTSERESQIARIQRAPGIQVVDSTATMLLVDIAEETMRELRKALPDWIVVPEHRISRPGPVLPDGQ